MNKQHLSGKLQRIYGAVKLPKNFDDKAELMKALEEKYGRRLKRMKK